MNTPPCLVSERTGEDEVHHASRSHAFVTQSFWTVMSGFLPSGNKYDLLVVVHNIVSLRFVLLLFLKGRMLMCLSRPAGEVITSKFERSCAQRAIVLDESYLHKG